MFSTDFEILDCSRSTHTASCLPLCRWNQTFRGVKVQRKNIIVCADSSASLASHTHFVLERQLIRLHAPEGTAKTSKHFVQALMAANGAGNTLAKVEMETEEVGVRMCVCVCWQQRCWAYWIPPSLFINLQYSICPGLVSVCNMRLITHAGLLVLSQLSYLTKKTTFQSQLNGLGAQQSAPLRQ